MDQSSGQTIYGMILYVNHIWLMPGTCFSNEHTRLSAPVPLRHAAGSFRPPPITGMGGGGVGGGPSGQLHSDAMQFQCKVGGRGGRGGAGGTDKRIRIRNCVRVRDVAQSPKPLSRNSPHASHRLLQFEILGRARSRLACPCRKVSENQPPYAPLQLTCLRSSASFCGCGYDVQSVAPRSPRRPRKRGL